MKFPQKGAVKISSERQWDIDDLVKEALKIEQVEIPCSCVNVKFNEVEVYSGDQLCSYKASHFCSWMVLVCLICQ